MNQRFLIFMLVAMALLMLNNVFNAPRQQNDNQDDVANKEKDEKEKPAAGDDDDDDDDKEPDDGKPGDGDEPNPKDPPKKPAVVEAPRPAKKTTLGSLERDAEDRPLYPFLVTLTTKGGAIERVELSNPQFRDIEDRFGYLGHLAPTDSTEKRGPGCIVHVVGLGTPAQIAGLKPGDLITAVGNEEVKGRETFSEVMQKTKPGQTIQLSVKRQASDDAEVEELTLSAELTRRPLEICRPEMDNYAIRGEGWPDGSESVDHPSLLLTLQKIGNETLAEDEEELPGIDLREGHWQIVPGATIEDISFRRVIAKHNLEVIKHYWLEKSTDETRQYHLRFEIKIKNNAKTSQDIAYRLDGPTGLPTEGYWYPMKTSPNWFESAGLRDFVIGLRVKEGYLRNTFIGTSTIVSDDADEIKPEEDDQSLAFIGIDAQYFAAVLLRDQLPDDTDISFADARPIVVGTFDKAYKNRANISTRLTTAEYKLSPGETLTSTYTFFAGPKETEVLESYELGHLIEYGWFGWVARPMTAVLHALNFGNFGVAIILLTVIVRLGMFPLSRKQVMGAQKMQQLQPEMKKLQEKYKNDRATLAKKQQELFRKNNYNPLSGCFPLFLQMPIFIGLYRALSVDIALRDASLFGDGIRWCSNLAAPDMFYDWSGWMPNFIQGMLGPFLNLLPLFTVVLFLVQQKMFMPPPADETAAAQQKIMTFMMIFIGFLFYKVASGLCLYFIVSSVWGIVERKVLPKTTGKPEEKIEVAPDPPKTKAIATPGGNGSARARSKKQKKKGRR